MRLRQRLQTQQVVTCSHAAVHEVPETLLPHTIATRDRIVPVLHRVLGTTWKELADVAPLVAHLDLRVDQNLILLFRPHILRYGRTEVVEPPLAALASIR